MLELQEDIWEGGLEAMQTDSKVCDSCHMCSNRMCLNLEKIKKWMWRMGRCQFFGKLYFLICTWWETRNSPMLRPQGLTLII